jgi:tripartite-type tricarboxylate transporter receptor subunit TctC
VVENKPGANGVIGTMTVKAAPADGYTILLASNSPLTVNPITIKDLPYDPFRDLRPLSGLTRGVSVYIVAADSKLRTVADLVAAAKSGKAPLNIGTYSVGYQLTVDWLANLVGVKVNNVPYKGAAPIFTDVMGNQLDVGLVHLGGVSSLLKSGKLRALAVTGDARSADFPDVPTVRESGYPNYTSYTWVSFYVRAETPDDIVAKLADALQKALAANDAKEYVKHHPGEELMPLAPAAMRQYQRDEYERIRRIAEMTGFKPE